MTTVDRDRPNALPPPRCEAYDDDRDRYSYFTRRRQRFRCNLDAEYRLPGTAVLPPMYLCEDHVDRYDVGGALREPLPSDSPERVPAVVTDARQTRLPPPPPPPEPTAL